MKRKDDTPKIRETGRGGLNQFTAELLQTASTLYPDLWYRRNLQTNVVRGNVVKTPEYLRGLPDWELLFRGTFFAIELKAASGVLSKDQKRQRENIIAAGGNYHVPRTPEEIVRILHGYGLNRVLLSWQKIPYALECPAAWEGTE